MIFFVFTRATIDNFLLFFKDRLADWQKCDNFVQNENNEATLPPQLPSALHYSRLSTSDHSGSAPSLVCGSFPVDDTSELAKAFPAATLSKRLHRLFQAKVAAKRSLGRALRALVKLSSSTNLTASELHLPPVSKATTTKVQRLLRTSSG